MRASLVQVGQVYETTIGANPAARVRVLSRAGDSVMVEWSTDGGRSYAHSLPRKATQLRPLGSSKLRGVEWLRAHAEPNTEGARAVAESDATALALDIERGKVAKVRAELLHIAGESVHAGNAVRLLAGLIHRIKEALK